MKQVSIYLSLSSTASKHHPRSLNLPTRKLPSRTRRGTEKGTKSTSSSVSDIQINAPSHQNWYERSAKFFLPRQVFDNRSSPIPIKKWMKAKCALSIQAKKKRKRKKRIEKKKKRTSSIKNQEFSSSIFLVN